MADQEKLKNQTIVIGHVALIQESKKQWFVLDVLKALRDQGHDAVAIFAGECREPEYMVSLEKKVRDKGLSGQVLFLGRRNDIPDLLKMIDVLMIPSSFEGFPLVGLEAATAGVPVAACNVAGAKEFIEVSGDGVCFEEDNVDEAVIAIEKNMEDRDEMIFQSRNFVSNASKFEYSEKILYCFRKIIA